MDTKDKKILDLLQEDGRMSLTTISKKIGLSIDATHRRIKKLKEAKIILPTIIIDNKKVGYPVDVDVQIKLKDLDEERYSKLIAHLKEHPNVISLFAATGQADLIMNIIAKDYKHLSDITIKIRKDFKDLIADWGTSLNLETFKYEKTDMSRL